MENLTGYLIEASLVLVNHAYSLPARQRVLVLRDNGDTLLVVANDYVQYTIPRDNVTALNKPELRDSGGTPITVYDIGLGMEIVTGRDEGKIAVLMTFGKERVTLWHTSFAYRDFDPSTLLLFPF